MSIFITLMAFNDPDLINLSKMAILVGSVLSGLAGFIWLKIIFEQKSSLDLIKRKEGISK